MLWWYICLSFTIVKKLLRKLHWVNTVLLSIHAKISVPLSLIMSDKKNIMRIIVKRDYIFVHNSFFISFLRSAFNHSICNMIWQATTSQNTAIWFDCTLYSISIFMTYCKIHIFMKWRCFLNKKDQQRMCVEQKFRYL